MNLIIGNWSDFSFSSGKKKGRKDTKNRLVIWNNLSSTKKKIKKKKKVRGKKHANLIWSKFNFKIFIKKEKKIKLN